MSANINVLINIKDKFSAPLRKLKSKINKLKNGIKKNPIDVPFNTKSFSSSLLNMKNLFIGGFVGSPAVLSLSAKRDLKLTNEK